MTSKIRHDVQKFGITSKTFQEYVMTPKRLSWRSNGAPKSVKGTSWRQKIVMSSKRASWHKGMLWHQKLYHDVQNLQTYIKCQITFLFAFVLRIFWHNLTFLRCFVPELSTIMCFYVSFPSCRRLCVFMFRSRVVDDYVFFSFCDLELWPWYLSTMQIYPTISIYGFITLACTADA